MESAHLQVGKSPSAVVRYASAVTRHTHCTHTNISPLQWSSTTSVKGVAAAAVILTAVRDTNHDLFTFSLKITHICMEEEYNDLMIETLWAATTLLRMMQRMVVGAHQRDRAENGTKATRRERNTVRHLTHSASWLV